MELMKKKELMKKMLLLLLTFVLALSLTACGSKPDGKAGDKSDKMPTPDAEAGRKTVAVTTFAVYDWVKNIIKGSDNIKIVYPISSEVDLHSYQPSADDIIAYRGADIIFCIGGESEEWIGNIGVDMDKVCPLMDSVDKKEEEVKEGIQAEEDEGSEEEKEPEYDEHIWLSLKCAKNCVKEICNRISGMDSANKDLYESNLMEYLNSLDQLDKEYQTTVETSARKTIIFGDRFPFRYMTEDYGLDYYASFIGCSAETEASFETIAFLSKKVDELNIRYICIIGDNTDIADSIRENTETKNQNILKFNSMQSIPNTMADEYSYIGIMQNNLNSLKEALK